VKFELIRAAIWTVKTEEFVIWEIVAIVRLHSRESCVRKGSLIHAITIIVEKTDSVHQWLITSLLGKKFFNLIIPNLVIIIVLACPDIKEVIVK
jgi:hypothetical protein